MNTKENHEYDVTNYDANPQCDTVASESELNDLLCSSHARWFRKHGATTHYAKGFTGKKYASMWIDSLPNLDWRAGFVYRLYGDSQDRMIVDKKGNTART